MALPAKELAGRMLEKHRRYQRYGRRKDETHAGHAGRLRRLQKHHEEAARTASSGDQRRYHEQQARDLEAPAGDAEYEATRANIAEDQGRGGDWGSALFLFIGAGVTLWLLVSGHLKAAGEAIGWLSLPSAKKPTKAKKK